MKTKIIEFLKKEFDIDNFNEPLISSGSIDSFALVTLITFLENEFSIKFEPSEILLENLDTVEKMENFIKSKNG